MDRVLPAAAPVNMAGGKDEMSKDAANSYIEIDPEKVSGTPVFRGTRVPIKHLFDYLEGGDGIETFIDHFPTVDREQVMGILEMSRVKLLGAYEITN